MNPYIQILLATVIWGATGAFVKLIDLPISALASVRLLAPTAALLLYFIYKKKLAFLSTTPRSLVWVSVINIIRVVMYFIGFKNTSVGSAIILLYTWPIFVTIAASIFLKEKSTRPMKALIALAFLGTYVIQMHTRFSFQDHDFVGMMAMLISSLCSAATVVIFKATGDTHSHTEKVFFQNAAGGLLVLPFLYWLIPNPQPIPLAIAAGFAIFTGVLGYSLFFSALNKIPSSHASFLSYFEVITTLIFSSFLLHEHVTWNMTLGGSMILFSVIFLHHFRTVPEEDI